MDWATIAEFVSAHWEQIKNALLVLSPFASSGITWKIAHDKLRMEADRREESRRLSAIHQIEQQRESLHTEMIEQTASFTQQFKAIINASEARNEDLRTEVINLRNEVTSLRKTLYRQRLLCVGCPKLPLLTSDDLHVTETPAAN